VLEAQRAGEPVIWATAGSAPFFPPNVAACGVDLRALLVVRAADAASAARGAERLLRSGAFGLVVLDQGAAALDPPAPGAAAPAAPPEPLLARLVRLAQRHEAALIALDGPRAREGGLGGLVSLRAEIACAPLRGQALAAALGGDVAPEAALLLACEARVVKDKLAGPGWQERRLLRPPPGCGGVRVQEV
jgi:recombination protein RecA